jgi:hypothetical protein
LLVLTLITLFGCQRDPEDIIRNTVPVADAGPSDTVTLPVKSITLTGSGHDSDGMVVAYLWSQVTGPGATTIVNPGASSTSVEGLSEGRYVFQLMVTDDDGATGVDTVSITVNPALEKELVLQPTNNPYERALGILGNNDYTSIGTVEILAAAWTVGGTPYTGRILTKFDLSDIPATAEIVSANLYLYSDNPPLNGNLKDPNYGDDNSMVLQRVTNDWSPENVNWFNQPQTTTTGQVLIPSTTQSVLDLNINITNLVRTMVKNDLNHGFLIRLQQEEIYTSRIFVSSYHSTKPEKHPKLVIVYK